jgi:hypothetical protein
MVRFKGFVLQAEISFFGSSSAFSVIAVGACADKVFPAFVPPFSFGNNMVDCKGEIASSAVSAFISVPAQNVLAGEDDFLIRDSDEVIEANNAGPWKAAAYTPNLFSFIIEQKLSFAHIDKYHCFFDIADGKGFVALVEDEHFGIEFTVCPFNLFEDANLPLYKI